MRNEAIFSSFHQATFTRHTDGGQYIVTRAHDVMYSRPVELGNHTGGTRLELVLENYEAQELQAGLGLRSGHLLDFHPVQFLLIFRRASYDAEAFVSILAQEVVEISWHFTTGSVTLKAMANPMCLQLSASHIAFILSGAPFTKTLAPPSLNCLTTTLARRSSGTNSKVLRIPNSEGACEIRS